MSHKRRGLGIMSDATSTLQAQLKFCSPAILADNINWFKPSDLPRGPKCFIICCDGTLNQIYPDESRNSNVSRLARCASGVNTPSGKAQVVAYQGGLGVDITPFASQNLSQVIGTGVDLNVCLAYQWLCEVYEEKSDIVLAGFGRGAFTTKVLAAFICDNGLLRPLEDQTGFRQVISNTYQAWSRNKRRRASVVTPAQKETSVAFRPDIAALALWDPVRSLAASVSPNDSIEMINEKMDFADWEFPDKIEHIFQVLATHEHREAYTPILFRRKSRDRQVLRQVWFPGTHSAIGGGSTQDMDRKISVQSLAWMLSCLKAHSVLNFDLPRLKQLVTAAVPSFLELPHPLHDSYNTFYKSVPRTPGSYFQSANHTETKETCRWRDVRDGLMHIPRATRKVVIESPPLPEDPLMDLEKEVATWVRDKQSRNSQSSGKPGVADFEGDIIDASSSVLLLGSSSQPEPEAKLRQTSFAPGFSISRKPSGLKSVRPMRRPKQRNGSVVTENRKIENIEIRNIRETFVDTVRVNDQQQNIEQVNMAQTNMAQTNMAQANMAQTNMAQVNAAEANWTQENESENNSRIENESWNTYQDNQYDNSQYSDTANDDDISYGRYPESHNGDSDEVAPDWQPTQDEGSNGGHQPW